MIFFAAFLFIFLICDIFLLCYYWFLICDVFLLAMCKQCCLALGSINSRCCTCFSNGVYILHEWCLAEQYSLVHKGKLLRSLVVFACCEVDWSGGPLQCMAPNEYGLCQLLCCWSIHRHCHGLGSPLWSAMTEQASGHSVGLLAWCSEKKPITSVLFTCLWADGSLGGSCLWLLSSCAKLWFPGCLHAVNLQALDAVGLLCLL